MEKDKWFCKQLITAYSRNLIKVPLSSRKGFIMLLSPLKSKEPSMGMAWTGQNTTAYTRALSDNYSHFIPTNNRSPFFFYLFKNN